MCSLYVCKNTSSGIYTTSSFGFHYTSGNKTLSESSHPRLTSSKTVAASNTTTTWRPFSRLWRFSSSARVPLLLTYAYSKAALYSLALISQQKQYQKFETESMHFNLFKKRLIFCKLERIFLNKNCKQKGEQPTLKEANSAYIKRLTS